MSVSSLQTACMHPDKGFSIILSPTYKVVYKKSSMACYNPLHGKSWRGRLWRDVTDGEARLVAKRKKTKTLYIEYR